jgi:hypothetical protein
VVLAYVAANRAVPIDVLAGRFFDFDPITGEPNAYPVRACDRRLQVLGIGGYIWRTAFHDGDRQRDVAMLGPRAAGITGVRPGRNRVAPRKRAHHVRTLDALGIVERQVRASGGRVLRTLLEVDLRLEQQRGRFTKRDDAFDASPDAACTIEVEADAGGARRTVDVAVEYVTSKYTDEDITRKHNGFGKNYERVMWFADRPRTAERVRKITGAPCTTLK